MNMKGQNNTVSAFDAKTHLSRLLLEVEQGNAITITRRGKPVARLVPVEAEREPLRAEDVLKGFKEIRSRVKGKVDIRKYIEEGRKR
jgi:prevent-host-death family protein